MSDELKPCPFGSKGKTEIEGKGQIWCGIKGYSDPQFFYLRHHGRLHDGDTFPTVSVDIRARTEEQAREIWNTRADLPATDEQIAARLHECVKPLEWVDSYGVWRAATPFGDYKVAGRILTLPLPMNPQQVHADEQAAKAAAEAHYVAQIMAALDLSAFTTEKETT